MVKDEFFKMSDSETTSEMFTRSSDMVNNLNALSMDICNIELVNKITCSFPKSWEPKVTTIVEVNDLTKFKLK